MPGLQLFRFFATPALAPAGQDTRAPLGGYERATNAQQRRLVAAYDVWAAETKRQLLAATNKGGDGDFLARIVRARMPDLQQRMIDESNAGIRAAVQVGVGRELAPTVESTTRALLAQNHLLIRESLIPGIELNLVDAVKAGAASDRKALDTAFNNLRHRPASYAGGAWVAIFEAQRAAGQAQEQETGEKQRVKWELDPNAQHCSATPGFHGCPDLAKEYDSWEGLPTVPAGLVSCRGL